MLLPAHNVLKPWGVADLPPPFQSARSDQIGEIWFEPPRSLPDILVKYIFTSEKLSVQVHPSDVHTQAAGLGNQGKEECWLITSAEPGASVAIGFKEKLDAEAVRAAALDGSIEDLLVWHPVSAGDFFYIPAGTVHAIGAGISLIEVQQTSDITYRLYDYGRPRELHLQEAMAVAKLVPYDSWHRKHLAPNKSQILVEGPHFYVQYLTGFNGIYNIKNKKLPILVLPLEGRAFCNNQEISSGQCALIERGNLCLTSAGSYLLISY